MAKRLDRYPHLQITSVQYVNAQVAVMCNWRCSQLQVSHVRNEIFKENLWREKLLKNTPS